VAEVVVKAFQPVEVDRASINPHPLDELPQAHRSQSEE